MAASKADANGTLKSVPLEGLSRFMAAPCYDCEVAKAMRPVSITACLYFNEPLDVTEMRHLLSDRLLGILRFRCALRPPVTRNGQPHYAELPRSSIRIEDIVTERIDVKSEDDLNRFCTKMYESDLGLDLPRWRAFIFNSMDDGRSMLFFCFDHSIGDGPSLLGALMTLIDESPQMPGVGSSKRKVTRPRFLKRCSARLGGIWGALCGDQMPPDQPNKLKTKNHRNPGLAKAVAQTPPMSMTKLKEAAAKFGNVTINDVLMVVVSLTLRQYFEKYDPESMGNQKVRANFPINMRPAGIDPVSDDWFGNLFSQGQLRFPVQLEDPQEILRDVKAQIEKIKISPEPAIRHKMVNALAANSLITPVAKKDIVLDAYGQVTAMLSNTAGPNAEVQIAGQPLEDLTFYTFSPIGLYFGIVSYNGTFRAGICCDASCEPEPERLAEQWGIAFDRVYASAMSL
jgi:hypothetical protein